MPAVAKAKGVNKSKLPKRPGSQSIDDADIADARALKLQARLDAVFDAIKANPNDALQLQATWLEEDLFEDKKTNGKTPSPSMKQLTSGDDMGQDAIAAGAGGDDSGGDGDPEDPRLAPNQQSQSLMSDHIKQVRATAIGDMLQGDARRAPQGDNRSSHAFALNAVVKQHGAEGSVSKETLLYIKKSTPAHVIYLMKLVIEQVCFKKSNCSKMEYADMPENLQECFRVWDIDGDGHVDAHELMAAADAWQKLKKESALMKKLLLAACIMMTLQFVGMFVMGMVTAELAKEFKAGGKGSNPQMKSKAGATMQVASSDTYIDANGLQMTRAAVANNTQNGRHLAGSGSGSVAIQVAKTKTRIVSTLPDSFWNALDELTIHSDKGHTLSLKIQGYARIPLRNSRCGNVLKLYTSVDGAIVFDSDDMSFEDKLDTLFKNAGFGVAVGGAAGRRLASSAGVDGFFNHISKMESEGSWKCGDIPLPRMPAHSIQMIDMYAPCQYMNPGSGKAQKTSCDSIYGGYIPDAVEIPAEHLAATLSKTDKALAGVQNGNGLNQGTLYTKSSIAMFKSPSYKLERTSSEGSLAQDSFKVTGFTEKKSITFQQMRTDDSEAAIRNFCKDSINDALNQGPNVDPVMRENKELQDTSTDKSMHFEYVGLEGEGDKVYRRFRMMPAKDFNAMMGAEAVGQLPNSTIHYWDRADDDLFTPYRIVLNGGQVVVFVNVSQTATDGQVEALLKDTVNATKFGNFVKPYKFLCDPTETGSQNAQFGRVPEISGAVDLPLNAVQFWTRWFLDSNTADPLIDDPNSTMSTSVASMTQAESDGNEISAYLKPAFTFLAEIQPTSPFYGFAKYALKTQETLCMADVCSKPCATERKLVQDHMDEKGENEMCSAPYLTNLVDCLKDLDPYVAVWCAQSPFMQVYKRDCEQKKQNSRRLQVSHARVEQLSDGTQSFDLGSLDYATRMHLSGALSMLNGKPSGDLKDYRFVFNASEMDRPTPNVLPNSWDEPEPEPVSRRLNRGAACDIVSTAKIAAGATKIGFCFEFVIPKPASIAKCLSACSPTNGWIPTNVDHCKAAIAGYCSMKLKFTLTPPHPVWNIGASGALPKTGWSFGVELGGSVNLLCYMFGICGGNLFGNVNFGGGIIYSMTPACPHVPFTLSGWAQLGCALGVKCGSPCSWMPFSTTFGAFSMTLKLSATLKTTSAWTWHTRTDSRRRRCCGFWERRRRHRRRRDTWQAHVRPGTCEVVLEAKVDITVFSFVQINFSLTFGMSTHILKMDIGAKIHASLVFTSINFGLFQQNLLTMRVYI